MKILFDKYGEQVQSILIKGNANRLSDFFSAIDAVNGWSHDISQGTLSSTVLDRSKVDVLILTDRMDQPFAVSELDAIIEFVKSGGGVWCMANHGAFSGNQLDNNHLKYASAVATTFFTAYQPAAYALPTLVPPVLLTGSNLFDHEIITGNDNWPLYGENASTAIGTVVTRSFCGIFPDDFGAPIVGLAVLDKVVNKQNGKPITSGVLWASALDDAKNFGAGRVVIGADCGWLGNTNTNDPGPGQFTEGDNPQYALNTIAWLGRL